MTVKNGEKKNTHETGRLTLRQSFLQHGLKILSTDQQYIVYY